MSRRIAVRPSLLSLAAGLVLFLAQPVTAGDGYPAAAFFLDGLTEESRSSEILAKPGMRAEFPYVAFETTFVPLESVCVDGSMLAIANPRLDAGVRTPAEPPPWGTGRRLRRAILATTRFVRTPPR